MSEDLVGGRYRVVRPLGTGGMGEVVVAVHEALGKEIALKRLRADATQNPDARARMLREARALAQLDHDNIVRVFDAGDDDGGGVFIAMELLHGRTLRRKLGAPLALAEALTIVAQIARGLEAAHAKGIVHRDLKPENIMLTPPGPQQAQQPQQQQHQRPDDASRRERVKILDFGLARDADGKDAVTTGAVLVGTPGYIAPERALKGEILPASDVYALGVIAFEALCGAAPFSAPNGMALVMKHALEVTPLVADRRPDAPRELADVVDACLKKDPAQRPRAGDVALRLEALFEHSSGATEMMPSLVALAPAPAPPSVSPPSPSPASPHASPASPSPMPLPADDTRATALDARPVVELTRATAPDARAAAVEVVLAQSMSTQRLVTIGIVLGLVVTIGAVGAAFILAGVLPRDDSSDAVPEWTRSPTPHSERPAFLLAPPTVELGRPLPTVATLSRLKKPVVGGGEWESPAWGIRDARPLLIVGVRENGKAALAFLEQIEAVASANPQIDVAIAVVCDAMKCGTNPELVAKVGASPRVALHTANSMTLDFDRGDEWLLIGVRANGTVWYVSRSDSSGLAAVAEALGTSK